MAKFKVVEDVEIEGKDYKAGDSVELEDSAAAELVKDGKVEADTSTEE